MSLSSKKEKKEEVIFQEFYTEVKEIEKQDAVLTPKQQIDRLLRPGSTYFNLNPFEVLQVEPSTPQEDLKKKYKRLSILVHPDKNPDDQERAQIAFDVVNRAYRTLANEETRTKCMDVIEEATAKTEMMMVEKRKKQKKEGKGTTIPEDDPLVFKRAIYVMTMKLFADMEKKRREQETRDMEMRKRKREEEIREEEKVQREKEWQKNYEESRETRVNSWKNFQTGTSKSKAKTKPLKPPRHRMEQR